MSDAPDTTPPAAAAPATTPPLPTLNVKELERLAIQEAMRRTGSVTKAAKLLGMGRATLYRRLVADEVDYQDATTGPND